MNTTSRAAIAVFTAVRLMSLVIDVPVVAAAEAHNAQVTAPTSVVPVTDFLADTNAQRIAKGLAPLTLNAKLTSAAQAKAADMVASGYWAHFRPSDGKRPWDFINEAGYSYSVAGENLARGYRTAEGITAAWMASPTHAANILSPKYSEVGFASVWMTDSTGTRQIVTVQMFGSPQ